MNKLKLIALTLIAGGILFAQQQAPISGGGPIPPIPTTPIAQTNQQLLMFQLVSVDPTQGSNCYNFSYDQFNYVSQTGWGCVLPPGTVPGTAIPTWQPIFGGSALSPGLTTAASASTLAVTSKLVSVTGAVAINTISTPTTTPVGARLTLIAATSATWTLGTSGNIAAALGAVTAGNAYPVVWDGSKWHPEL